MSGTRVYEVRHRTEYGYQSEVTASYGRTVLTPRDTPDQWCRWTRVQVDPEPDLVSERVDFHGNRSLYVEVRTSHTQLIVQSSSLVEVTRDAANLSILDDRPWDEAVVAGGGSWLETEFLLPSPQVPALAEVRAYAERVFTAGRALGEAVGALVSSIHRDFAYTPGATSVHSTMPELLRRREGVCQDFAHLAVGCLRAVGVPARYVSGYLETEPPPGSRRLEGADASHAWFSVLLPELGWVDLDPTNDQPVDARYVVTAWGRDYSDVPPLKGVIFTEGVSSRMNVAVDVIRHV